MTSRVKKYTSDSHKQSTKLSLMFESFSAKQETNYNQTKEKNFSNIIHYNIAIFYNFYKRKNSKRI